MDFLLFFSVLFFLLRTVFANQNQGIKPFYENIVKSSSSWTPLKQQSLRSKRSTPHKITEKVLFPAEMISGHTSELEWKTSGKSNQSSCWTLDESYITECVFVTSEEGFYYYKATENSEKVCGIYLFTDPDKIIEVQFEYLNVPCTNGGLITFFDGWELNGKFFPGIDDHEKHFVRRYKEFCGEEKSKKVFFTSQNAGMLHYRIPDIGRGFSLYVKFHKNPTPCNILVESKEDIYTLRNYGRANNCTLIAVFPAKIKVLALDVGVLTPAVETGTIHQCGEKKMSDGLQIGGSDDLDPTQLVTFEEICGLDSTPEMGALVVGCEVSVVRLVSSGQCDNSATFSVGQPDQIELLETTLICEV